MEVAHETGLSWRSGAQRPLNALRATGSGRLPNVPLTDRHRQLRQRALGLIEAQLERLRAAGPERVRELATDSPLEVEQDGVLVTTRIDPEGERLLVLVETSRGSRMLATGGFAMEPDGSTHTPD